MAAYAALVSLQNTIHQIMNRNPPLSTSLHHKQIQSLEDKTLFLLDFIEGYIYGGASTKEFEDLESQITSAALTAEDIIESHIANQILGRSSDDGEASLSYLLYVQKKMANEEKELTRVKKKKKTMAAMDCINDIVDQFHVGSIEASLSCSHYLQKIIAGMDGIVGEAKEWKEKYALMKEEHLHLHHHPTHSTPALMETATMVGFREELFQLMDELTDQRSSRQAISIVGMGGVGKTNLAQNLYHNSLIKHHFDIRAWATISQQYNANGIIPQLLSSLGAVDASGEQLHKTLCGRRYLIVLDDIWGVEAWDELRRFFPNDGNGSRVLLTTRSSNVANECGSSCFQKNLLNESESWELFCVKAFHKQESCPAELEGVGKEIVELCKGLPLSIVVIGGSLRKSPRTLAYWDNVAQDIKSISNSKEKQESLDVLLSSYKHLPARLKPCFLYIGMLKAVCSWIPVPQVINLWVAEGFLRSNSGRALEQIAEVYLKDLIARNMILVGEQRDDGRMKTCDIHDLLRDLCLRVGQQEDFFHVTEDGRVQGTERPLLYKAYSRETAGPPLARFIMENCDDFKMELSKHRLLRILDACYQQHMFGCVNLRYLSITNTGMGETFWELPPSVSLAWNLQTLILKGTVVFAPIEIWKLQQLRHIECCLIYLLDPSPSNGQGELVVLENLHTLTRVGNFKLSEDVCKIIPNIKKLHLLYDDRFQGYDYSLIECLRNLDRFHKLESLRMMIKGSEWPARAPELNKMLTFPTSLKKLSLSFCGLHWDDLRIIGALPLLEVLKLKPYAISEGKQWNPVDGQFHHLKYLKIEFCDLYSWNARSVISQI